MMRYWTVAETQQAQRMRAEKLTDRQIGIALHRSTDSVYARLHHINRGITDARSRHDIVRKPPAPRGLPEEVRREAIRVERSPVTLSMAICGDPRRGRSVLDRRVAGIPEPPEVMPHRPNAPPPVSLPSFDLAEVQKTIAALQARYADDTEDGNEELN
jgi:hypothetical protein